MNVDLVNNANTWAPGSTLTPGEINNSDLWRISIAALPEGAAEYELYFAEDEIQRANRFHFPRDPFDVDHRL